MGDSRTKNELCQLVSYERWSGAALQSQVSSMLWCFSTDKILKSTTQVSPNHMVDHNKPTNWVVKVSTPWYTMWIGAFINSQINITSSVEKKDILSSHSDSTVKYY